MGVWSNDEDLGTWQAPVTVPLEGEMMTLPSDSDDRARFLAPALALGGTLVWIGAALWLTSPEWGTMSRLAWVEFVAALAVLPALVGVLWLLIMRTSRAEARRFGRTAAAMRAESARLERSAAAAGRALADNRAALAEQVELLAATSQAASSRFAALGQQLTADVAQVDERGRALATAASSAETSLATVLTSLPRARAETEEAIRVLERAGLSAGEQAAALEVQVSALAERGRDADSVAGAAAQRLAAHIARMEATSETAGMRLESVTGEMSAQVDSLLGRTAEAVDEARKGIAAQGDAMLAMIDASQTALGQSARENADVLAERISRVEELTDRIAARLAAQRASGDLIVSELDQGLAGVDRRLSQLHEQGVERSQMLAASISALGGSADAMTEALRTGEAMATRTIGTTESLLIALDAAAREIDETLPDALARLDMRVTASRQVVGQAKPELLALVSAAESTHDAIEAIATVVADQRRTLDTLSAGLVETLSTGRIRADELGQVVDETINRTHRFAEEAAPRLIEALLRVRDTASAAADRARETLAGVIPEAASALEAASEEAMRRATSDTVERQVAALAQATDDAVAASTRATERLAVHVQQIADQTALVETRLEVARAERDEADRNTMARRVSLLIESLNSSSIDITKAFASEVSDSSWAAYLKGDRGVFTRRAVRILDAGEARDVGRLYDDDDAFREQVNRYIHDFESMLRAILAQPDGSPLGVTLLSSDMGKLYVALAQAIERLR